MTKRDDLVERNAATERDLRQALAGVATDARIVASAWARRVKRSGGDAFSRSPVACREDESMTSA